MVKVANHRRSYTIVNVTSQCSLCVVSFSMISVIVLSRTHSVANSFHMFTSNIRVTIYLSVFHKLLSQILVSLPQTFVTNSCQSITNFCHHFLPVSHKLLSVSQCFVTNRRQKIFSHYSNDVLSLVTNSCHKNSS